MRMQPNSIRKRKRFCDASNKKGDSPSRSAGFGASPASIHSRKIRISLSALCAWANSARVGARGASAVGAEESESSDSEDESGRSSLASAGHARRMGSGRRARVECSGGSSASAKSRAKRPSQSLSSLSFDAAPSVSAGQLMRERASATTFSLPGMASTSKTKGERARTHRSMRAVSLSLPRKMLRSAA